MELTFKETLQVAKIGLEILAVIQNAPTVLQELVFNQLKEEYATKVITENFNSKIYEKLFVERNLADYISMVEEISSEK